MILSMVQLFLDDLVAIPPIISVHTFGLEKVLSINAWGEFIEHVPNGFYAISFIGIVS